MNLFKKVMTFFSAIWNAILWRKIDKKAKRVAKSAKEGGQGGIDSDIIPETEKLFVDVPLHSPEANELLDQELLIIRDEAPAALAPIVALNFECKSDALNGLEEETSRSLSFFSEPIREGTELETLFLSSKHEIDEIGEEENAGSHFDKNTVEAAVDEHKINGANEVEQQKFEDLATPPGDSIIEEMLHGHNCVSEPTQTALLAASSILGNVSSFDAVSIDGLETQQSSEIFKASSNHLCIIPNSKINPDLSYLAIGDEIHLFDHDGIIENEENEMNDESLVIPIIDHIAENDSISRPTSPILLSNKEAVCEDIEIYQNTSINEAVEISDHKSFAALETVMGVSEGGEIEQNPTTSSSEVGPIGISVSSIQANPDSSECTTDSRSKYSTNYMVKSDSLVNFLLEDVNDFVEDVADSTEELTEISENSQLVNGEFLLNRDVPLLSKGSLEEVMCTARGILKLSGDHHVDCVDENDGKIDTSQEGNVKTTVDDFLEDAFSYENPLLMAQHLEGCMEEPSLECEESQIFREILRTVESGLEDSQTVEDLDEIGLAENETGPDFIGKSRSITGNDPESPSVFQRYKKDLGNDSPPLNQDEHEVDEEKRSRRLSQLVTFHYDEPDSERYLDKSELLNPTMSRKRLGEVVDISGSSNLVPKEKATDQPNIIDKEEINLSKRSTIGSMNTGDSSGSPNWPVIPQLSEPEGVAVISDHVSSKQGNSMFGIHEKSCLTVDSFHLDEDSNEFSPFIDCSSYLFRIPEEIRRESGFNPCVGAAPLRKTGCTADSANMESAGFDVEHNGYNQFQNMNMVPNCAVPVINKSVPGEYKNTLFTKIPRGYEYNQRPVPRNVGTFWGNHPGIIQHTGEQHAVLGYPVNCPDNYYEDEHLNVIPTTAYVNDQTNDASDPEHYGFMNPYGALEFPMLGIPFCVPQSHSAIIPTGPLAPLIFPIGPNSQTESLPSLMTQEAPAQIQQYPIPSALWGAYSTDHQLPADEDDDNELTSGFEVRGLASLENISTGTNDDDENCLITDPYFQLADNNSLHTVKSKADSYTGSLFCESLRSIMSHNTENENTFPSFSCISVQGCCPSILVKSCETTLSNDSLPLIIAEEKNTNVKSMNEDYSAKEKFMNDVNTALNESVLDQVQGQLNLESNLLGRGDCSMSINSDQSEHQERMETSENDVLLRNSLGENISINNSKLTLLDGVLGSENGGSRPDPMQNLMCNLENERSDSINEFCIEVLDSIVESVTRLGNETIAQLHIDIAETNVDGREGLDEPLLPANLERDLVVQNMMYVESLPDQAVQIWSKCVKQKNVEDNETGASLKEVVGTLKIADDNVEEAAKNLLGYSGELAAERTPGMNRRRSRRQRKKLSDVSAEHEIMPCVSGNTMGDGIGVKELSQFSDQCLLTGNICCKPEDKHKDTSKSDDLSETGTSKKKLNGESLPNISPEEPPKSGQDVAQKDNEVYRPQEEEDEPCENPGNPSANRRRRNRRKKRKV